MQLTALTTSRSALVAWPELIPGDYEVGVVRLVTLVRAKVNHLLFASVELLPSEMPVPPPPAGGGWKIPVGNDRLCVGRAALPVEEALSWYAALLAGKALVPGLTGVTAPITAAPLAPEPDYQGFTLQTDALPFSPAWHGRPRLHRLIPMAELAEPVCALRDGSTSVDAMVRARAWLRERIHFDLLAHDDWLGFAALVAPNPLLRWYGARIVDRSASAETLEIGGPPRRGADVSTLRMSIEEVRGGAPAWRAEGPPNSLGRLRATARGQLAAVQQRLICDRRGLLDLEPPAQFIRDVSVSHVDPGQPRTVAPPRRAAATEPRVVFVRPTTKTKAEPLLTPLRQLERLQQARTERWGEFRPAETPQTRPDVQVFERDRDAAVDFVRGLVASARIQVLLVDPYLEADDLQEFATATTLQGVAIRGLINPRPRQLRRADVTGDRFGDQMLAKLGELRDPAQGFGDIDVRVSKGRRLHDRFLQIDEDVWHAGHSFNKIGTGAISMMTRLEAPAQIRVALAKVFAEAQAFEPYWLKRAIPPWSFRRDAAHQLHRLARWIGRPRAASAQETGDE